MRAHLSGPGTLHTGLLKAVAVPAALGCPAAAATWCTPALPPHSAEISIVPRNNCILPLLPAQVVCCEALVAGVDDEERGKLIGLQATILNQIAVLVLAMGW